LPFILCSKQRDIKPRWNYKPLWIQGNLYHFVNCKHFLQSPIMNLPRGSPVRVITPSVGSWQSAKPALPKAPKKDVFNDDKAPTKVRIAKEEANSKTPEPADSQPRPTSPGNW